MTVLLKLSNISFLPWNINLVFVKAAKGNFSCLYKISRIKSANYQIDYAKGKRVIKFPLPHLYN